MAQQLIFKEIKIKKQQQSLGRKLKCGKKKHKGLQLTFNTESQVKLLRDKLREAAGVKGKVWNTVQVTERCCKTTEQKNEMCHHTTSNLYGIKSTEILNQYGQSEEIICQPLGSLGTLSRATQETKEMSQYIDVDADRIKIKKGSHQYIITKTQHQRQPEEQKEINVKVEKPPLSLPCEQAPTSRKRNDNLLNKHLCTQTPCTSSEERDKNTKPKLCKNVQRLNFKAQKLKKQQESLKRKLYCRTRKHKISKEKLYKSSQNIDVSYRYSKSKEIIRQPLRSKEKFYQTAGNTKVLYQPSESKDIKCQSLKSKEELSQTAQDIAKLRQCIEEERDQIVAIKKRSIQGTIIKTVSQQQSKDPIKTGLNLKKSSLSLCCQQSNTNTACKRHNFYKSLVPPGSCLSKKGRMFSKKLRCKFHCTAKKVSNFFKKHKCCPGSSLTKKSSNFIDSKRITTKKSDHLINKHLCKASNEVGKIGPRLCPSTENFSIFNKLVCTKKSCLSRKYGNFFEKISCTPKSCVTKKGGHIFNKLMGIPDSCLSKKPTLTKKSSKFLNKLSCTKESCITKKFGHTCNTDSCSSKKGDKLSIKQVCPKTSYLPNKARFNQRKHGLFNRKLKSSKLKKQQKISRWKKNQRKSTQAEINTSNRLKCIREKLPKISRLSLRKSSVSCFCKQSNTMCECKQQHSSSNSFFSRLGFRANQSGNNFTSTTTKKKGTTSSCSCKKSNFFLRSESCTSKKNRHFLKKHSCSSKYCTVKKSSNFEMGKLFNKSAFIKTSQRSNIKLNKFICPKKSCLPKKVSNFFIKPGCTSENSDPCNIFNKLICTKRSCLVMKLRFFFKNHFGRPKPYNKKLLCDLDSVSQAKLPAKNNLESDCSSPTDTSSIDAIQTKLEICTKIGVIVLISCSVCTPCILCLLLIFMCLCCPPNVK